MSGDPCSKEKEIDLLFQHKNQVNGQLIKIGADVSHIKDRLDAGLGPTIKGLGETLEGVRLQMAEVVPIINRHTSLEKRVEDAFWWFVKSIITCFVLLIIGLMIWAFTHGYKPVL